MVTSESDRPGTSTPCQKLSVAKRQVASSSAKACGEGGLGQVALDQDRGVELSRSDVGRGLHGPVAGEEGQGPAAGGGDRGPAAPRASPPRSRADGDRGGGRRSRGGRRRRSRTGCRRPARRRRPRGRPTISARPGGMVAEVSTAVRCSHTNSVEHGGDVQRRHAQAGLPSGLLDPGHDRQGFRFMVTSMSPCSVVTALRARSLRVFTSAASEVDLAERGARLVQAQAGGGQHRLRGRR